MLKHGFFRVAAASPLTQAGDISLNVSRITETMTQAHRASVDMLAMPELCISGYTCGDLFQQELLLTESLKALELIAKASRMTPGLLTWVGLPLLFRQSLYNCAAAVCDGVVAAIIPKTYLPSYQEFYEKRWFSPSSTLRENELLVSGKNEIPLGTDILVRHKGVLIGAEVCEDLWSVVPPSSFAAMAGALVIANLSASNEVIGKHDYLLQLIRQQSARTRSAYVYASAGCGESTQDVVYSGNAIIAENGKILAESPRFTTSSLLEIRDIDIEILSHDRTSGGCFGDAYSSLGMPQFRIIATSSKEKSPAADLSLKRFVDPYPFVPSNSEMRDARCSEILAIQSEGLMKRLQAAHCKKAAIGISGGLDSTLALLVTAEAFDRLKIDRKGIIAVTMPGFGTTRRTHSNADVLMERLGVSAREISIYKAVRQHFLDIGHDENTHDVVYENSQARERTQILMDIANKEGALVIGTGDLSELALGWATYNGDHISMYGVNASIPKTLVKYIVENRAVRTNDDELKRVLLDIIDTPISPELTPADEKGNIRQKTEDLVGPYPLHDFFLYHMLRHGFSPEKIYKLAMIAFSDKFDSETIMHWLKNFYRRFFSQQFKRSCLPDGPKVGSVCLSPRGDWRMPSDITSRLWLESLDAITAAQPSTN